MIHPLVVVPDHEGRLMCSDMTCATDKRSVEGGCFVSTTQCSDVSLIMELDYFVDVCVSRYVYRVLLSGLSDRINRQ